MQAIYDFLYEPGIPLKAMGFIIGLWLIVSHALALVKPDLVGAQLKAFPRNEKLGIGMVIFGFLWAFILWSCMDLGEFFKIERPVQVIILGVCIGVIIHVKEFIAVRALGFLMILAAAPILESAFLKEPQSRLLIVAFAYAIAVKGMFWVGMPYLMRDQINWVLADKKRLVIAAGAGFLYGLLVLVSAILFW
ncbi:MAG: hypothetical protein AAF491_02025 [Verrucomicrobiota bacterium]